jgi:hypothetical protein
MLTVLFYVALGGMLLTVAWMLRVHALLLQHRHALVVRLGEVTMDLPPEAREASCATTFTLLEQQQNEIELMRPLTFWRQPAGREAR